MTERQQLAAVRQDDLAIRHIKEPSEAVQLAAVQQDGCPIKHTEAPSVSRPRQAVSWRCVDS